MVTATVTTTLIWLLATLFVLLLAHLYMLTKRVLRIQGELWEMDRTVRQMERRLQETAPDDREQQIKADNGR